MNKEELISMLELVDYYSIGKNQLEAKQPYHMNIIDELYINENGHSRILAKLLQYKSQNQHYEMLESLIAFIAENIKKDSFGSIKVVNPEITQEKERIDLWVRDEGYAIIAENKIYNAIDQDAQLSRYIDKTKEYGYREDQIFVIYLSQNGDGPTEQSWGDYKVAFHGRYASLSFRKHILPWLKEYVLPNVRIKETVLRGAIEQYIDYLEGIFDLRTQNNAIKMETEKMIIEKLNLDQFENDFDKVKFLQSKIEEVNELYNQLANLKDKYYQEAREKMLAPYIQQWNDEIKALYPRLEKSKEGCHVGLLVPFRGDYVNVRISEDDDKQMYCQIDKYGFENQELNSQVVEIVSAILPRHGGNVCVWKYFDINDFDGVFKCFKDVMDLLIKG